MNQLDQAAQANAASAEEIAATSGEINNLALGTQEMTVELNSLVLGTNHGASTQKRSDKHSSALAEKKPQKNHPTLTARESRPLPKSFESSKHNVVPLKTASKAKTQSEDFIPFDEDDNRAKVGTTDGF